MDTKEEKYNCEQCKFKCNTKARWNAHINTELHRTGIRKKRSDYKEPTICEKCEYKTDNKKDYNKHKLTRKHLVETDVKQKNPIFTCECDQLFYSRTTLWRHKKKCLNKKEHDYSFVWNLVVLH